MKRVSVGDVQHNFSDVLRAVSAGEEVQIVKRKRVVARIVPDSDSRVREFPDFVSRSRSVFGAPTGTPPSALVEEDRYERL
ncbi:MAG: type II toxin-antitoxin system prevent-host-death family antitoxin [Spirochaetaceae bacterium]|nr:MAG: type II toxin-antitoxin system prevent-host-death family antitoxin [Spirochaetaceae bacterium]